MLFSLRRSHSIRLGAARARRRGGLAGSPAFCTTPGSLNPPAARAPVENSVYEPRNNRFITSEEYFHLWKRQRARRPGEGAGPTQEVRKSFRFLDTNTDGKQELANMRQAFIHTPPGGGAFTVSGVLLEEVGSRQCAERRD